MRSEVDAVPQCENYGILLLCLFHKNPVKSMISQRIDNQKWINQIFFIREWIMVFSTLCVCSALATAGCKFTQITLKNRLHASLQEEVQIQKHWWLNFCYSFRAKKVPFLKFSPFLEKQLPLHILLAHLEQLQHHDFFRERNLNPFFSSEKRLMVNFLVRIIL